MLGYFRLWLPLSPRLPPAPPGVSAPQHDVELVAVTDDAAISFTHRYGGVDKAYIMEMGASGGAWLDYDVDGWVDLVLVNALPVSSADPPAAIAAYERGAARTTAYRPWPAPCSHVSM